MAGKIKSIQNLLKIKTNLENQKFFIILERKIRCLQVGWDKPILRKSNFGRSIISRGEVMDTPVRIKVACTAGGDLRIGLLKQGQSLLKPIACEQFTFAIF